MYPNIKDTIEVDGETLPSLGWSGPLPLFFKKHDPASITLSNLQLTLNRQLVLTSQRSVWKSLVLGNKIHPEMHWGVTRWSRVWNLSAPTRHWNIEILRPVQHARKSQGNEGMWGQLDLKPKALLSCRWKVGDQMQALSFLHLCHVLLHFFFNPSSISVSLSEPYTLYFKSKARSNMLELRSGKKMHFCRQRHTTVLQRNCYSVLEHPHNDSSCCNQDCNGFLKEACFQNHLQLTNISEV